MPLGPGSNPLKTTRTTTGKTSVTLDARPTGLVLVHTAKNGVRSEIKLSGADLIELRRQTQGLVKAILLRRFGRAQTRQAHIRQSLFFPTKHVAVDTDLHQSEVLLTVRDQYGGEEGYALDAKQAVTLAEDLRAAAALVERAAQSITRQ